MKNKEICPTCGEEEKEDCSCRKMEGNESGGCCGGNCSCGQ